MTLSRSDLLMASVSGPTGATPGQQIGVVATVKNQGNGSSGGFYVSVYLSTDPVITPWDDAFETGDLEIGAAYVAGLAAGAQQTLTINCTIPSTLTGTYYLGAIADSRNGVAESNENNNSLAGGQITIAR
jgi:subtilase family serine protease